MTSLLRLVATLLLPVGLTLILVLLGLWRRRRALIWAGAGLLGLSSLPLVSALAMRAAEGWAVRGSAVGAPAADAIVVLSEGRTIAPGTPAVSEWGDADRFFGGVELFRAGKAPLLLFTGGVPPGVPGVLPEGTVLVDYARGMGVPAERLLTTGPVANTADEARAVSALLRARSLAGQGAAPRVLLVTSAFHMPRARTLFERAGLTVAPFPVDFQVSAGRGVSIRDFVPTAAALSRTELAWHELYGRLFYAVARW